MGISFLANFAEIKHENQETNIYRLVTKDYGNDAYLSILIFGIVLAKKWLGRQAGLGAQNLTKIKPIGLTLWINRDLNIFCWKIFGLPLPFALNNKSRIYSVYFDSVNHDLILYKLKIHLV